MIKNSKGVFFIIFFVVVLSLTLITILTKGKPFSHEEMIIREANSFAQEVEKTDQKADRVGCEELSKRECMNTTKCESITDPDPRVVRAERGNDAGVTYKYIGCGPIKPQP